MNSFEALLWTACAYVLVRIVNTGNQTLWLWFGLLAGIGLENKYSMLLFGAGVCAGLLLTPQRRAFRSLWIWIAGALAFLLFLPDLLWNIQHHFPFLELQANIRRSGRNVDLTPLAFFAQEAVAMLPLAAPIWLAGLWFYLFSEAGRPFRALGWAWVFTAAAILILNPRVYYLFPAYPMLFAAGGVMGETWTEQPRRCWVRFAYPALMVLFAAMLAPVSIPVLPVETYIRYARALHYQQPAIENVKLGPLPQIYADQFGWEEMTAAVARVYNSLPPEIRAKTAIFGQNYGQAGAVDLFGPKYELPNAISGHQNYFFWGPRGYTGESVFVMQGRRETLERLYDSVEKVAHVGHPYAMPYEHFDVFYCRGLKGRMSDLWPQVKNWH